MAAVVLDIPGPNKGDQDAASGIKSKTNRREREEYLYIDQLKKSLESAEGGADSDSSDFKALTQLAENFTK
ncbi:hypothetical protein GZ77_18385 [Endozoicomonas montiporae]|uniref:Uncharacterized protein n=1 Tax=Endozoicomonas montiporae TaxID=1027273 RepID=A0A081N215_9GAMM|nr:hypothetical protein [Endozoicomonas montiporae]KEQ12488.1 hypothetical protein GZ77_18385 [Endozoicomonas montiporae]